MNDNIYWVEEGPTTIALNETQGTVVAINYSAYHRAPQSPYANIRQGYVTDARTTGPFSATFTADTITWQDVNPRYPTIYGNFSIDRTTGVFVGHLFADGKSNGDTLSYTCRAKAVLRKGKVKQNENIISYDDSFHSFHYSGQG